MPFIDFAQGFRYYFFGNRFTMMHIITLGDPLLKKHSVVVPDIDGDMKKLVEEMFDTLAEAKGIGLAAVQVGRLLRLFVTKVPKDGPRVFINPDILETSIEQEELEEGCLSIPGINADVMRSSSVRVQAWNEKSKPFTLTADGLLARVIQHEIDHLNGVLFIDRINTKKKSRLLETYEERVRL
jgi:peptide deformylase